MSDNPVTDNPEFNDTSLENVDTPEIFKLFASKVSLAKTFFHLLESDPISYEPLEVGTKLEANSPLTITSSLVESPMLIVPPRKVTTPINSEVPLTVKFPPTERSFSNVPTPTKVDPPETITPPLTSKSEEAYVVPIPTFPMTDKDVILSVYEEIPTFRIFCL